MFRADCSDVNFLFFYIFANSFYDKTRMIRQDKTEKLRCCPVVLHYQTESVKSKV